MARIEYTGDIGRAPMPSTLSLLEDHLADCEVKVDRLMVTVRGLKGQYGDRADDAILRVCVDIGYWRVQARHTRLAIQAIRRGEQIGKVSITMGGSRDQTSDRGIPVQGISDRGGKGQ